MIEIVLADDQTLVRAGFRALLDAEDDVDVVGEAADGEEAVELAGMLTPDVVLMDVRMPKLDGLGATRAIAGDGRLDGVRIVIVTTFELDEYVFGALRAGAAGFLLKDIEPADLVEAVRIVAAGEALLAPSVTNRVIAEFARRNRDGAAAGRIAGLTDREREVLRLMAGGLSNAEIADALVVTAATVKTHVARVLAKLGARDRLQAVVAAYESGFMDA